MSETGAVPSLDPAAAATATALAEEERVFQDLGAPPAPTDDPRRHRPFDDIFAGVTGTALVALGLAMFQRTGLATGGTAGLSLLLHYATGWPLGVVFSLVNLPFYVFSYLAVGAVFTIRSFLAVSVLSLEAMVLPKLVSFAALDPVFAAGMGGLLIGVGILVLMRHKASLGGFGVLAFYLQEKHGLSAGKVQMALDSVVVALALTIIDWKVVVLSIGGAVVLNLVLAINHKPGRYVGF